MDLGKLRGRRAGDMQPALRVLSVERDQMNTDQLCAINSLTALVRAHDLGLDARRPLSASQIKTIAAWRERVEPLRATIDRREDVRLAERFIVLDSNLKAMQSKLTELKTDIHPRYWRCIVWGQ